MRHVCARAVFVAAMAAVAACSNDKNPASPTPTPNPNPTPAVTVQSINVTATARTSASFQMTAKANLSDGSSRDVTGDSQWATSNADLATISAAGVLTVVHSGRVDVRATYQNVTGSMSMTLTAEPPPGSPTLIILSGSVSETPPGAKSIEGVTVRVTDGPGAGRSTTTDSQGRFGFTEFPAGQVGLEATKAGYVTWKMVTAVDHDREIQIVMFPTPPTDSSGAAATARCNDGTWSWAQTKAAACTANGGVAYTVCPGALCETQTTR